VILAPWQAAAVLSPFEHFYFAGGVATGKTYTGSEFSIYNLETFPELTGFIGANTYDQLSQATLREFISHLEDQGYDYVIDQKPPISWQTQRQFKTYKNVISVRPKKTKRAVVSILTRVLSDPDALRGIQFSWYWMDETRDTPRGTHDVILSRMRESKTVRRGLITSTTNGEDWAWERFVSNLRKGQRLYGAMHIPTSMSVNAGILSPEFYHTLKTSYSPIMAMQELDAMHVNVRGGLAYYSVGNHNRLFRAPWGDAVPNRDRPLIIGCDFNYSPAPCVWMVGQMGPTLYGPNGEDWINHIHWFGEIVMDRSSSSEMTIELLNQYPNFFYRVYGDAYGGKGTTSNAGEHDYNQIAHTMEDRGAQFTIDYDQSNPHVKDRVENMNRLFRNSVGETVQTFNPSTCPMLDSDTKVVGWKPTIQMGRGKLDNGGDLRRTHASDGAGYACWKLFPPGRRGIMIDSIESSILNEITRAF
jgi:hypothetical protein